MGSLTLKSLALDLHLHHGFDIGGCENLACLIPGYILLELKNFVPGSGVALFFRRSTTFAPGKSLPQSSCRLQPSVCGDEYLE